MNHHFAAVSRRLNRRNGKVLVASTKSKRIETDSFVLCVMRFVWKEWKRISYNGSIRMEEAPIVLNLISNLAADMIVFMFRGIPFVFVAHRCVWLRNLCIHGMHCCDHSRRIATHRITFLSSIQWIHACVCMCIFVLPVSGDAVFFVFVI